MRIAAFVTGATMILAIGCGSGDTAPGDGTTGIAQAAPPPPPPEAAPGQRSGSGSCSTIATCAITCAEPTCIQTCFEKGSPSAQAKFDAFQACTVAACAAQGACAGPKDASQSCIACAGAAGQGPTCAKELGACLGDK